MDRHVFDNQVHFKRGRYYHKPEVDEDRVDQVNRIMTRWDSKTNNLTPPTKFVRLAKIESRRRT